MAGLVVRPRARILHGHDWVYTSEVLKVFGSPADGDIISVKDGRDQLLGVGIFNSKSQIIFRRFSRRRQDLDLDFFQRRIHQAMELRERSGCDPLLCRIVWSESDGLPGVIADRYGSAIVLQTLTMAMDQRKDLIVSVLAGLPGVSCVIERNDAPVRAAEGLPSVTGILSGESPGEIEISIHGVKFLVDPAGGQKTGFYLDQVDNYGIVARHAQGRRVLDCFSNQGGFALACARAGATEVTAVESGVESARRLRDNALRNNLAITTQEQDVFDFLQRAESSGAEYDLIILDPPSFTKAKGKVNDAMRGYRDLHRRVVRILSKNGIIATFSCSHHVGSAEFEATIAEGLTDGKRSARITGRMSQSKDHPIILHHPESEYLKGLLLEAMPGR